MTTPSWKPSVADVAAIIRARTKQDESQGGAEAGTFNETTRPTAGQVETLISNAVRHVTLKMGRSEPCKDELKEAAKGIAAMRAALLIEQSYWPEQTRSERSSFERLKSLYDDEIKALVEAVAEQCGGSGGESGGSGEGGMPSYGFSERTVIGPETLPT